MHAFRFFSFVATALFAGGALAQNAPTPKPKVAVLAIQAEGGVSQGAANLLSELVTTDLTHSERYSVLSTADIATMLGFERQKQLVGCKEDDSCFAEIGEALGVDVLVSGSVGALGATRVLTLRAYDAKRSLPMGRETASVESEAALVPAAHTAVAKLFNLPTAVVAQMPEPKRVAPGWFVLGAAGALTIVGVALGVSADSDYQKFKASPFDDALGNSAQLKANFADGLYVTAAVTAVVATVLLLVQKPAPATVASSESVPSTNVAEVAR